MEKVAGEQGFAHQQHFTYKSSEFPKIQTVVQTYSLIPGASNLAILVFSMRCFNFWLF